jgi:hypothetical protein
MEDITIYKIYRMFGAGMSYYGLTIQPLYERKATHKSHYKNNRVCCSSKIIMEACEDWDLEIVEILPIGSTQEDGLIREKWWIDNNECVNINSPIGKTLEEMKEYKRKWAEQNRREKGIQPKNTEYDAKKYAKEWAKNKRASLTDEERAEINRKKREHYANNGKEKQQEYLKRKKEKKSIN